MPEDTGLEASKSLSRLALAIFRLNVDTHHNPLSLKNSAIWLYTSGAL